MQLSYLMRYVQDTLAIEHSDIIDISNKATASIDMKTANEIQQIIREEMKESTVITIAHRLDAVKNATHFIKLDKGRINAQGEVTPHMLSIGGDDLLGLFNT